MGSAICFGLGGIFVEIFKDTTTEMAPLSHDDALRAIHRVKALPLLQGARGRPRGDIDALATLLVRLGDFAVAHAGRFRTLDLNPIIVKRGRGRYRGRHRGRRYDIGDVSERPPSRRPGEATR